MKAKPPGVERLFQIETCRAANGCPNANMDPGPLVAVLEEAFRRLDFTARLRKLLMGERVLFHHIFRVSISGCPNACSRPQIADFGLVGQIEPHLEPDVCNGCGDCARACPEEAIVLENGFPRLDRGQCLLCGNCVRACTAGALHAGTEGLAVMAGGRLGRHPRLARPLGNLVHSQEAVSRMTELVESYLETARPGERFGAFLDRRGLSAETGG